MGGDCSIAFPVLGELYSKWGPIALVHFDAHTDTWDEYWGERYTHGTAVRRAIESGYIEPSASVQVGIRGSGYGPSDVEQSRDLGLLVLTADQVHADGASETARRIVERVGSHPVLVHFDIDCLDPAHAPGTGMPEVGGLTTHDASVILVGLAGIKVVAGEVTEVLPAYDPSGITAIAAANVLFELASLAGSHD
jgi:agmatinase